jgi:hypothetical protein
MLGVVGAALGVLAGMAELTVGPSIRTWIGNKQDTTRLGLATIALSAIALASSLALARHATAAPQRQALLGFGVLVPAAICFTTVGRFWYVPGALLITSGVLVFARLRGDAASILAACGRQWTAIFSILLGLMYVALGVVAHGLSSVLGIAGGLVTCSLVAARGRIRRSVAVPCLMIAVVPFAVLTWWSLVTPLIAVLTIGIGVSALRTPVEQAVVTPPAGARTAPKNRQ